MSIQDIRRKQNDDDGEFASKICPLMSGRLMGVFQGSGTLQPIGNTPQPLIMRCVRENCQFWNEEREQCSRALTGTESPRMAEFMDFFIKTFPDIAANIYGVGISVSNEILEAAGTKKEK